MMHTIRGGVGATVLWTPYKNLKGSYETQRLSPHVRTPLWNVAVRMLLNVRKTTIVQEPFVPPFGAHHGPPTGSSGVYSHQTLLTLPH